ncbi:disease resistance protein RPV1-like isoform X2 [Eucalyptus grandis]|uniref:disease resistance protein RPV1-like isoform X2 n=1 Tax=Eucalyptus grandis TaxID=71139 RepID=UPI00192EA3D1|nr:disease resistance protein RPV1-like isoform X2 [Eucalyptus grandis]
MRKILRKGDKHLKMHEGELIERVVETVLGELRKDFPLLVPKELVGLDDQLKKIISRIGSPSINARMIGIYGMGGIGKTTLAKCIYNQLLNKFDHVCFLPDIRETTKHHGIKYLQSQLISEILQEKNEVSTVDLGINLIKSRFTRKKVLILLDDIDCKDQLDALAGGGYWFASGSIIIVTTRNKDVLDQSEFEVDYEHEMSGINEAHSFILFNRHAFRMEHPSSDFAIISRQIISTMGGLPLALKVIGSYLYKKTYPKVWDDVLKQLKKQPHKDVQKILKISYDALDNEHKEVFLDIACFFIGEKIEFAMYMWDDCEFYPSQGIDELKSRCLIKIEDDGTLSMHDQLRDLGRSIIRQEPSLEKRSRLWVREEASEVLEKEKGTEMIHAIRLNWSRDWYNRDHQQAYTDEQFKKLPRLRFLQLKWAALNGDFNELFSELRWLQWFNLEPNPSFAATNLLLPKLVVLSLSSSQITEHWGGWSSIVVPKRLKVLELTCCKHLRCTPELSAFTKLEILSLKECSGLKQVHPSIGKVKSLLSLNLSGCQSLKELPGEVGTLRELKELILDYSGIKEIPTSIGSMEKLEKLSVRSCQSLTEIPGSMGTLRELKELILDYSGIKEIPTSIGSMEKLEKLSVRSCWSLTEIPGSVGDLPNLQHLNISGTTISVLPESIKNLSSLQHLNQRGGKELRSLPELPSDLTHLELSFQSPKLPQFSRLNHMEELNISWTRST